jgi:hypothetical protein
MRKLISLRFPSLVLSILNLVIGRVALTLAACLLSTLSFAQAASQLQTDSPRSSLFPQTKDGVHLEMVFNFLLTPAQLKSETGVVDLVWGSSYATQPIGMYNSAYIPISVDNFTHSVAWYRKNHPDWLEYRCDKKTLAYEFGVKTNAPLDFTNPDVQAYQYGLWVDAPLAAGYQGIAVDTMDLTNDWQRCGHYDANQNWVQQYIGNYDDPAFRHDLLAWEAAIYKHVHQYSQTATMQINVSYHFGESLADNQRLMTTADLLFDERGYTNYGVPPSLPTPSQWETITTQLDYIQSKGLCYMTNGEESGLTKNISQAARLWAIGNYLLVKGNCTYMYMTGYTSTGGQDYGRLVTFPEYKIAIGHPLGRMKKTQGVWMRAYSSGLTYVNPYMAAVTVALPAGHWVDMNGHTAGSTITLDAQTAKVLLAAP